MEETYNKLKDTKDKLIVTGNDIQKRLSILTGLSKKTTEEMEEMKTPGSKTINEAMKGKKTMTMEELMKLHGEA